MGRQLRKVVCCPDRWLKAVVGRIAGKSGKRGAHMSLKCIGIDIGGTSVKLGIFEEDGTLVKKWEIPTRKEENGKYILGDIAASIRRTAKESGLELSDFSGAGMGFPGPVLPNGSLRSVCKPRLEGRKSAAGAQQTAGWYGRKKRK